MASVIKKCPYCFEGVAPTTYGDCPACGKTIVSHDIGSDGSINEVVVNPQDELQFYCVVCEDFFFSQRDETGYDQAPCPVCGDLSITADFHVGEMQRGKNEQAYAWLVILKVLIIFLLSGAGWAIFQSFF